MVGALLTIPFNICIENIAVIWGMLGNKNGFYVVKKDVVNSDGGGGGGGGVNGTGQSPC